MDHGIKCVLTRLAYSATQYKREKQEQKGEIGLWCLMTLSTIFQLIRGG